MSTEDQLLKCEAPARGDTHRRIEAVLQHGDVASTFKSYLDQLTTTCKMCIESLSMFAIWQQRHAADIAKVIETGSMETALQDDSIKKLAIIYLIDSFVQSCSI